MSQADSSLCGQTIAGRYRVERRLGQGGMGAIYLATQEPLGRPVVLKVLLDAFQHDKVAVARFEKEALSISRLVHPHIVTLFDFGRTEAGALFIAMELLNGRSLRDIVYYEGKMPWPRALRIVFGVAKGLAEAHRHGIIHRDLKPENVMVVRSGDEEDFPKILDFGLARSLDAGADEAERVTQQNMVPGTPAYIAPERVNGESDDLRSDLYSLGAVWFELLTGETVFSAPTPIKVIVKHLQEPARRPSLVAPDNAMPADLEEVLLQLLAKHPGGRPPDARTLVRMLAPFATQESWAAAGVKELSDPGRDSPDAEAVREWAARADEIPDLDFGSALGIDDAPPGEQPVLLTQPKRPPPPPASTDEGGAPIALTRRKSTPPQAAPPAPPLAETAPPAEAGPPPSVTVTRAPPPVPASASHPPADTEEIRAALPTRTELDFRPASRDDRSVAVAAARLNQCQDAPQLGEVIVQYLRARFDRALVLDLRPVPFRVLAASGCLPFEEPVRVFEPARGFWKLVRQREPHYGPSPFDSDWDLFHSHIGGHRPGAILVATLRRAGYPALTIYGEHDAARLHDDLSDTAILLKEAAAAMSAIGG